MKNTKKLISVLLAALMLLPGFSGLGLPAFAAAEEYDLWIEGTRVTSANCQSIPVTGGSAAFEAATNTLTLNGATLASDSAEALIRAGSIDLTIDALGESRLVFSDKNGIEVDGSLTVTSSSGSGTIAFEMNTGENAGSLIKMCKAIDAGNCFSLNSGTLQFTGNLYNRDGYSWKDAALIADSCHFSGGRAVFNMNITDNNKFRHDASTAFSCIYARDICVSDSAQIEIDCKDARNITGAGFEGIYSYDSFTMTGGKLSAVIEGEGEDTAILVKITTQISGGEIYVDAGNGRMGFSGEQIQISGGTFEGYGVRSGLFAMDSISITGGTIKTIATGKTGRGLLANKGISITGVSGSIYAKGGEYAMLNLYNGITIKDNAVITSPERGTIGASTYGYPVIADQNGDPVKEATILPAVSCLVVNDDGTETPVEFNRQGVNAFEVPVGETRVVKVVSNVPGKTLDFAGENGPIPQARSFLHTDKEANGLTYRFEPTYRPTGESTLGSNSVRNDRVFCGITDSDTIGNIGAVQFTVVKGDLTLTSPNVVCFGGTPGEWMRIGTLTVKNAGGQTVSPTAADTPFDTIGFILLNGGPIYGIRLNGNSMEVTFTNTFGSSKVTVSFLGNDSFNPATAEFTLTRYCSCKNGEGLIHHEYLAPTCQDGSNEYWECETCGSLYADQSGLIAFQGDTVIPATGEHQWGENSYVWANDNTTCTATCPCTVSGCQESITETAKATREQTKAPTCTDKGEYTYTAAFNNKRFYTQTTSAEIPALDHTPAQAVRENEVVPTCTEAGSYDEVVCCADCREELSRKTVTVPALGHEDADNDGKCDRCGEKTHDFSAVLRSVVNIFQRLTKRAGNFIKKIFAVVLIYLIILIG